MKNLKNATLFMFIVGSFVCCHKNKDKDYFNGDIRFFDDSHKIVKNVTSKTVTLDGANYGMIAVYDSLLICWNPKLPDYFFNIFNVDTGEEIGSFCRRGGGPEDAYSVNCIFQFFKKGNDLMTLLGTGYQNRLLFWNISQSIEKGTTVFDTIVSFNQRKEGRLFLFYQVEDILFAYVQSDFLNNEEATTPFYEKRMIYTDELLQEYPIYKKKSVRQGDAAIMPVSFLYSWDVIKPDGSKIVQAMKHLPQVNILDTRTGEVVGYRMKDGPDFSLFETNMQSRNAYYTSIHADDNYIYASYWGKEPWDASIGSDIPFINTIHVFDWEGKQLYELITDRVFFRIWLDQVRNRLYTIDLETDEVSYLTLDDLNLY